MRLAEKLARTDDKIVQMTLRIKNSVAEQLKADVEETERSVNELAAKLIETAIDLPVWIGAAGDFFASLERPAFLLIAEYLAREINSGPEEEVHIVPVTAAGLGVLSPTPLKVFDLTPNGEDLIVDFHGEIWTDIVDDPHQAFVMSFAARFNLHVPLLLPDLADAQDSMLRLKPMTPRPRPGLTFLPPLRELHFKREH